MTIGVDAHYTMHIVHAYLVHIDIVALEACHVIWLVACLHDWCAYYFLMLGKPESFSNRLCKFPFSANIVLWAVHIQHSPSRQSAVAIDYRVSETEKSKFYFTEMQFPCAANRFECVCAQDQEMHLIKWVYSTHCTLHSLNRAKSIEPITYNCCDCAKWNIFRAFSSWKYGTTANASEKAEKVSFFHFMHF